ncbi:MAG: phosphomannomutase/phosphoglucomutase [Desulfobacterales bacterium]|nr:phosphomannomutase/phosphoglucomutase [Desulfobacterales bacterium]
MLTSEIFRQYDIRGIVGKDMDDAGVVAIGQGVGTYLKRLGHTRLTVGRDCRVSSDAYRNLLIEGLISTGCHIVDIGICTTPMSYFSIRHLKTEGSVMVTASHNPPEYNGFKICRGEDSVYGEMLQEIRKIIDAGRFETGAGRVEPYDILNDYIEYITGNIRLSAPLRIGVDAGNGTAGAVAVPIFKKLGCTVHDIYCDMDGTFPHHEADPTVAGNMKDLIALVKEKQLDAGIAFDGDGDRIGVVDKDGSLVYGDQLLILFAREILSRKPGATIISEVKCSQTMYNDIKDHGGNAVMYKTGHSMIKEKMKETGAELAGEMSGHIFFKDRYFGYDDAVYAACRLLEILADTKQSLTALLSNVPKTFNTPEIRVDCPDDQKFDVVRDVTARFRKDYDVIDIDGARVLMNDGWGLVRASNTQPALVLRFEARNEARLAEIRRTVEAALESIMGERR